MVHNRAITQWEVTYASSSKADLDLELALDLRCDEPVNTDNFTDSSIYAREGAVYGATTGTVDSERGTVWSFDGDDYVEMLLSSRPEPGYNGVPSTEPRTFMTWVKAVPDDTGILVNWGHNVAGEQIAVRIFNNVLRVSLSGTVIYGQTVINDGEWHHIAVVAPDNIVVNMKLYVDGIEETRTIGGTQISTFDTFTLSSSLDTVTNITTVNSMDVKIGANFEGCLDNLVIHQRALREYEIVEAYLN